MPRKLENTKDAEHPEGNKGAGHVVVVCDPETDVVGQDGDDVDDAHHAADELAAIRRGEQSQQILCREYHNTGGVQTEEHDLVPLAAGQSPRATGPMTARHGLHHVGHHRHRDEEARHVVEDERRGRGVRVLEGPPHLLPDVGQLWQVLVSVLRQLVVHKPLGVLPLPVPVVLVTTVPYDVRQDAEERQLLVVAGQAFVFRIMQLPRAVVVENVSKNVRIAIEKILLALLVEKELAFVGAQKSVGVLF